MDQETRPGILNMGEYRDGSPGQSGFPGELSTVGITALVLIFHPYHVKEFEMTCEGTENWQGREAWKAHFEQRMDQPARMSALRVGAAIYSISEGVSGSHNYPERVAKAERDAVD